MRSVNSTSSGAGNVQDSGDFRALDRQQAKRAVGALRPVERHIRDPEIHDRHIVVGTDAQRLIRILGSDRHHVPLGVVAVGAAALAENRRLAERLPAAGAGETVFRFHPVLAAILAEQARPHLAHDPAVQELMVHVHQVLVHETVVAGDLAAEPAGLVTAIAAAAMAGGGTWTARATLPGNTRISAPVSRQG